MHLVSERSQTVHLGEGEFHFEPEEMIITEFSYKHTIEGFSELAASAGFQLARVWTDPQELFAVFHFTTLCLPSVVAGVSPAPARFCG